MISGAGDILYGVCNRRRSGCRRKRCGSESGYALFEHRRGGVHEARVDVARFGKSEASRCLRAVLEHI